MENVRDLCENGFDRLQARGFGQIQSGSDIDLSLQGGLAVISGQENKALASDGSRCDGLVNFIGMLAALIYNAIFHEEKFRDNFRGEFPL